MPPVARALLLGALLGSTSAAAAPCPALSEVTAALHSAAVEAPAAAAPLAAVEAALACAPRVEPAPLAALFDAQAAYFTALGAVEEAALAQATAARLRGAAPLAAPADPPPGALRLAPAGPLVQLNGAPAVADQPLQAGFYAVLIEGPAGRTAQLHALWPGEDLHITAAGAVEARAATAPVAPAPIAAPPAPPPRVDLAPAPLSAAPLAQRPAPARPWFIAAGGAAAAAAVTASIARAQIGAAAGATAQADIDRARRVQLATGISSYALMATTGGLVVVGLRR